MKAIATSIVLLGGVMLMLMSATTLVSVDKLKHHKSAKPEEKERLISLPARFMMVPSNT
jgi:hypothetical protein